MNRRGFTLIELMLAIVLGSLVVYVAFAGIWVTSQTIVHANKLSLDNTIMRAGMQIAFDNTDFWTDRDDPTSALVSNQNLRVTAPDKGIRYRNPNNGEYAPNTKIMRGQAFTPFSVSAAPTGNPDCSPTGYGASPPTPTTNSVVATGTNELSRGWDPNAWHAAAARTWCYKIMIESHVVRDVPVQWRAYQEQMQGRYHLIAAPGSTGITPPNHPWQQGQATGLLHSLGIYGMMDYLPANTPLIAYAYVSNSVTANLPVTESEWTTAVEWTSGVGDYDESYKFGGDWQSGRGGGRYGVSHNGGFSVPNRNIAAAQLSDFSGKNYILTVSGTGSYHHNNLQATKGFEAMIKNSEYTDKVLRNDNKPSHWPSLQVSSLRFIREGCFINLNRIVMTSSLTGQSMQISFSSFGTTLRGARQQRAKGLAGTASGWVNPFSVTPSANLDSQ